MTYEERHSWTIDRTIIELLAATIHLETPERENARGWLAELAIVSSERENGGPRHRDETDEPVATQ